MSEQSSRTGQKIGWLLGWIGGYIWVLILSLVFLYQGKSTEALAGLIQFILWIVCVFYFSPWRHPDKIYLILMLPLYVIFIITILWSVWAFGGTSAIKDFNWLNSLWFLSIFIPIPILYKKKWNDKI